MLNLTQVQQAASAAAAPAAGTQRLPVALESGRGKVEDFCLREEAEEESMPAMGRTLSAPVAVSAT